MFISYSVVKASFIKIITILCWVLNVFNGLNSFVTRSATSIAGINQQMAHSRLLLIFKIKRQTV